MNGQAPANGAKAMNTAQQERPAAATLRIDASHLVENPSHALTFFGDYTLIGEIASGAMGVVYRARQRSLNRTVALKMIRGGTLAGTEEVRRFRVEAEAAAALDHPNIVPIYEIGELDGRHFFSMKLIEGGSLAEANAQVANRDARWLRHAAQLTVRIARALQHAHDRGVLHRDLKPSNILLDERGEPNISDFGLAKLMEGDASQTHTGAIMGTPSYMAPEQAEGSTRDVTTSADVYGLGAIFYALLTGKPPFSAPSVAQVLELVRREPPPPPSKHNPRVSKDLETICLKCLQKTPSQRYRSAASFADDLERWLRGEPIVARPITVWERSAKWVRRNPALASLIAIAAISAIAGVSGIAWQWRKQFALNIRFQIERAEEFFSDGDSASGLTVLARVLRDDPHNRVAAARIVNALHHQRFFAAISDPLGEGANLSAFAPDGRVIVAGTNASGSVVTLSRPGLTDFTLALPHGQARVMSVAVARGGVLAATGSETGAALWNGRDGKLLREWRGEPVPFVAVLSGDAESPPAILFVTNDVAVLCSADSGELLRSFQTVGQTIVAAAVSPDEQRLVAATDAGALWFGALAGKPTWFSTNAHEGVIRSVQFSSDSTRVVSAGSDKIARQWDARTGEPLATFQADESLLHAGYNPKGSHIVTATRDGVVQLWDAQARRAVGEPMKHPKAVNAVRFHPGGDWIVTACADGAARLWSAREGQLLAATPVGPRELIEASFSADGRSVLTLEDSASARLWAMLGGEGSHPIYATPGTVTTNVVNRSFTLSPEETAAYATAHGEVPSILDVTSDGRLAGTAASDFKVRIWNRRKQRPTCEPLAHDGLVNSVRFSSDGRSLVTSTAKRRIRVWDSHTGHPLTGWIDARVPVTQVWLSGDGHFVVTAENEIWSVNASRERPPEWLPSLAESVAGVRYSDAHVSEPVPAAALAELRGDISKLTTTNWLTLWAKELLHEIPVEK